MQVVKHANQRRGTYQDGCGPSNFLRCAAQPDDQGPNDIELLFNREGPRGAQNRRAADEWPEVLDIEEEPVCRKSCMGEGVERCGERDGQDNEI